LWQHNNPDLLLLLHTTWNSSLCKWSFFLGLLIILHKQHFLQMIAEDQDVAGRIRMQRLSTGTDLLQSREGPEEQQQQEKELPLQTGLSSAWLYPPPERS
jgi:hypothetical protein